LQLHTASACVKSGVFGQQEYKH